jgi:hypothetical protein
MDTLRVPSIPTIEVSPYSKYPLRSSECTSILDQSERVALHAINSRWAKLITTAVEAYMRTIDQPIDRKQCSIPLVSTFDRRVLSFASLHTETTIIRNVSSRTVESSMQAIISHR